MAEKPTLKGHPELHAKVIGLVAQKLGGNQATQDILASIFFGWGHRVSLDLGLSFDETVVKLTHGFLEGHLALVVQDTETEDGEVRPALCLVGVDNPQDIDLPDADASH